MKRYKLHRLWVIGLVGFSAGFAARAAAKSPDASHVEIVSLADSVDPLKTYFNENQDKLRFVTILSPT